MVVWPEEYHWLSYHYNVLAADSSDLITPYVEYLGLGDDVASRCYQYRELFGVSLAEEDSHAFRKATYCSLPIGTVRFLCKALLNRP